MPSKLAPGLYIVATPIGNLADITLRAIEVLGKVDSIACEDTRITRRLLDRYSIATSLTPYHEHNAARVLPRLLADLTGGASLALVADAGTPLVSDPGYRLVTAAVAAKVDVISIPGPSAVTAALAVAGLPTDRVLFAGFLPSRAGERRRSISELADIRTSLVLFESPRRLATSLADLAATLGPRPAAVVRELTKCYEEVRRGPLDELARHYASAGAPRGEIVVVIGPPLKRAPGENAGAVGVGEADAELRAALESQAPSTAATKVAAATGLPRRALYARALELRKGR